MRLQYKNRTMTKEHQIWDKYPPLLTTSCTHPWWGAGGSWEVPCWQHVHCRAALQSSPAKEATVQELFWHMECCPLTCIWLQLWSFPHGIFTRGGSIAVNVTSTPQESSQRPETKAPSHLSFLHGGNSAPSGVTSCSGQFHSLLWVSGKYLHYHWLQIDLYQVMCLYLTSGLSANTANLGSHCISEGNWNLSTLS